MTVGKTWAYATGSPLVAVNTLHLLAVQASRNYPQAAAIAAVIDAQRGQWFAHVFQQSGLLDQYRPQIQVVDPGGWLESLPEDVLLTGPALVRQTATATLRQPVADSSLWHPSARQLGQLALRGYHAGRVADLWRILPDYGRLSAAQEKKGT
jgi:tRNA A37 threonylcarbamoyladenosine modification protein TsaB